MTRPLAGVAEIKGLWTRSLIRWPDGRRDTTTAVRWMQTASLFIDLRQPVERPSFDGVTCLRDLDLQHIDWLARQEGFAGETHWDGRHVEWRRAFDFQPKAALPDAGRMWFDVNVLVEEGRDIPYVEHWHREVAAPRPCAGMALTDTSTGQRGMLVRAGNAFMVARARQVELPRLSNLIELIHAAPSRHARQALVDAEVSFGSVDAGVWRIRHSILPYKEGQDLQPRILDGEHTLRSADLDHDGNSCMRLWNIDRVEGTLEELFANSIAG